MFHQKPLLGQRINWTHPLSKHLTFAVVCIANDPRDLVGSNYPSKTGTPFYAGDYWDLDNASWFTYNANQLRSALNTANRYSVVMGVKSNGILGWDTWGGIFCKNKNTGTDVHFGCFIHDVGDQLDVNHTNADTVVLTITPSDLEGKFHNFAFTYDGSNVREYLDSTLKGTHALAVAPDQGVGPVYINRGRDGFSADCCFRYVYIFDRALSNNIIAALNYNPYIIFEDPLPIELMHVAAGGISIPVVMQQMNQFNGGQLVI